LPHSFFVQIDPSPLAAKSKPLWSLYYAPRNRSPDVALQSPSPGTVHRSNDIFPPWVSSFDRFSRQSGQNRNHFGATPFRRPHSKLRQTSPRFCRFVLRIGEVATLAVTSDKHNTDMPGSEIESSGFRRDPRTPFGAGRLQRLDRLKRLDRFQPRRPANLDGGKPFLIAISEMMSFPSLGPSRPWRARAGIQSSERAWIPAAGMTGSDGEFRSPTGLDN